MYLHQGYYRWQSSRVMIDTHAHPALIPPYSIDPIRDRLAPFLVREVMDQGLFRFSLRLPFLAAVAVISYQFLFLIHGNDRQPLG